MSARLSRGGTQDTRCRLTSLSMGDASSGATMTPALPVFAVSDDMVIATGGYDGKSRLTAARWSREGGGCGRLQATSGGMQLQLGRGLDEILETFAVKYSTLSGTRRMIRPASRCRSPGSAAACPGRGETEWTRCQSLGGGKTAFNGLGFQPNGSGLGRLGVVNEGA